jgi:hypothetical protein
VTSLSFLRDHDEDVTPQAVDWMALTDCHETVSRRLRAADDEVLLGDVWKRANLSPRDLSLVTAQQDTERRFLEKRLRELAG